MRVASLLPLVALLVAPADARRCKSRSERYPPSPTVTPKPQGDSLFQQPGQNNDHHGNGNGHDNGHGNHNGNGNGHNGHDNQNQAGADSSTSTSTTSSITPAPSPTDNQQGDQQKGDQQQGDQQQGDQQKGDQQQGDQQKGDQQQGDQQQGDQQQGDQQQSDQQSSTTTTSEGATQNETPTPAETPTSTESSTPAETPTPTESSTSTSSEQPQPTDSAQQSPTEGLSQDDPIAAKILETHNYWRQYYGSDPVSWNTDLSNKALAGAQKCENSPMNIQSSEPDFTDVFWVGDSVDGVTGAVAYSGEHGAAGYDYSNPGYNENAPSDTAIWTQMVWKGTKEIGCVWHKCDTFKDGNNEEKDRFKLSCVYNMHNTYQNSPQAFEANIPPKKEGE